MKVRSNFYSITVINVARDLHFETCESHFGVKKYIKTKHILYFHLLPPPFFLFLKLPQLIEAPVKYHTIFL